MSDTKQQKELARLKRGQVKTEFIKQFDTLGQRICKAAIPNLCLQLSCEQALYAKIAISNALSSMGAPAIPELLKYIGKIGDNQHDDLPTDIFKKWNYPCPRDIAIRCIIRIGEPVLKDLNEYSLICNQTELSEIINAIGHISFYEHDLSSFGNLMAILGKYNDNNAVITWRVIRALQAFPTPEAVEVLKDYLLHSNLPEHRWEAARSLGQIVTLDAEKNLKFALQDDNSKVKEMVKMSLQHIRDKSYKTKITK